jgi:hypothetical protein
VISGLVSRIMATVLLLVTAGQALQAAQIPAEITISSAHERVATGTQICIDIRMLIKSATDTSFVNVAPLDFDIQAEGPNGTAATPTQKLLELRGPNPSFVGNAVMGRFERGAEIKEQACVSELYRMNTPGKYKIQVSRKADEGSIIKSNELTITVGNDQ